MSNMNWLGIIVAAVVAYFIGFLWYGVLFEAEWQALTGVVVEEGKSDMTPMILGFFQTLVTMVGLGWFIGKIGGGWMGGAKVGLVAAVCFAIMTTAYAYLYEGAPMGLMKIDWSHLLLIYGIGGAIIGGLKMKAKA